MQGRILVRVAQKVGENLENKQILPFQPVKFYGLRRSIPKLWRNRMSEMLICETLSNRFHPGGKVCAAN